MSGGVLVEILAKAPAPLGRRRLIVNHRKLACRNAARRDREMRKERHAGVSRRLAQIKARAFRGTSPAALGIEQRYEVRRSLGCFRQP